MAFLAKLYFARPIPIAERATLRAAPVRNSATAGNCRPFLAGVGVLEIVLHDPVVALRCGDSQVLVERYYAVVPARRGLHFAAEVTRAILLPVRLER